MALILIFNVSVSADNIAEPTPYQIEFENGNKIFYMYPTGVADDESCLKSGLYHNTDPLENIYLINMYAHMSKYFYQSNLIFSNDGIYFANMPWTSSQLDQSTEKYVGVALEFYANGRLVKQYDVSQLVEDSSTLKFSVSHVFWENYEKREFDEENNILSVTTSDNIIYKFDIASGDIIEKINIAQNFNTSISVMLKVTGVVAVMMVMMSFTNKNRRNLKRIK